MKRYKDLLSFLCKSVPVVSHISLRVCPDLTVPPVYFSFTEIFPERWPSCVFKVFLSDPLVQSVARCVEGSGVFSKYVNLLDMGFE